VLRRMTPVASLALVWSLLYGPSPAAAQAPTDEALIARIDALAARALDQPGGAGFSVAVARGSTVILDKGYGKADLEHEVPATNATLFRIASVTKQYTAAAIMKLVEGGMLALDDDITKFIEYPTHGKTITVRHLLTHTSGIKNYTELPDANDDLTVVADLPPEKVLDGVRNLPLDFEPGSKRVYSNTGYHLLGMIIEKVSGRTYAEFLKMEFLEPLNLARTRYDVGSEVVRGRARGYTLHDGRLANAAFANMSVPYAAGSLMASAGDLVAWQIALVSGNVVSSDSYGQMITPASLTDGSLTDYGFGLRLGSLDGHPRIMHGGGITGFNSVLAYYPDQKVSVAVISNSEAVPSAVLEKEIAREALGIAPRLKDLALPAAELESFVGNYRINQIELDFAVTVVRGKLFVQGPGQPPVPVLAQGDSEFRASWDPSVRIVFDAPAAPGAPSPSFAFEQGGEAFKAIRVP
jgi:D-alanyl-D-alanine carboxypeptidase